MAYFFIFSKGIIFKASKFVDLARILGAQFDSKASSHRLAHKHHLSPGFKPGKSNSLTGVDKSLPLSLLNSKKDSVIIAQTV